MEVEDCQLEPTDVDQEMTALDEGCPPPVTAQNVSNSYIENTRTGALDLSLDCYGQHPRVCRRGLVSRPLQLRTRRDY